MYIDRFGLEDRSKIGATASQSPDNPVPLDLGADRPDSVNSLLRHTQRDEAPWQTDLTYYSGNAKRSKMTRQKDPKGALKEA